MMVFTPVIWRWLERLKGSPALPAICPACRAAAAGIDRLCASCAARMAGIPEPRCRGCGGAVDGLLELCGECLGSAAEWPWDHAVSVFAYDGLVRDLIHAFKYRGATWLAPYFAHAMAVTWQRHGTGFPEVVVPVPMPHWRQWSRGYNQAALLAEGMARELGVPVAHYLHRRGGRPRQATLGAAERQANVAGAFVRRRVPSLAGRSILLADDVLTTGATLAAATRALRADEDVRISVVTLARG